MHFTAVLSFVGLAFSKRLPPNVCKNFADYFTMDPQNCWHNPDVYLPPEEIILNHGYPLEKYLVETEDYYILKLHRMPRNNSKATVLIQPAAFTTYSPWVDKGKGDSLGFLLWDAGYDVWLGNFRGTTYGRKHKFLDSSEKAFWNFSFHEVGKYDIPAQIDFIAKEIDLKPQSVIIISYSYSSTASIVYCAIQPEHCQKWMKTFILMAPTTLISNIPSYSKYFVYGVTDFLDAVFEYSNGELLTRAVVESMISETCKHQPVMTICIIVDLILFGNVAEEEPPQWLPMKFTQNPSGVSLKSFMHYIQMYKSGRFQQFDYGAEKNLEYYGSEKPPNYNQENIQVPLLLIIADHDTVSTTEDVLDFYSALPEPAKIYKPVIIANFSHGSFFYGTNAAPKVYKPVIKFLDTLHT